MAHVEILDRETGGAVFDGEELFCMTTRFGPPWITNPEPRPRWMVNKVWTLPSGAYVLLHGSYSVIYHTAGTRCSIRGGGQSGSPATVDDLPDDAEPCPVCQPPYPGELGDGELIRYEFPRQHIDRCDTAAAVREALLLEKFEAGVRSMILPEPSRYFLDQCAIRDPAFRSAGNRMQARKIA